MLAIRGAVSRFYANDGFFLGAGLAFFFLVTMIPLTLLSVSTLGFVLSSEQAADTVVGQMSRNFPVYKREIQSVLMRIVATRAASGVVGTIVLVMFSTSMFGASRLVLHRLLGIRTQPSFFRNLVTDAGLVMLLGVLLFAATVVTWLYQWLQVFVLQPAHVSKSWLNAANLGVSLALSSAMFYLLYRYVPRRRVRPGSALVGALVASLLWEVAKQLFTLYIREVGVYDQIYGPLGVLVAAVMFVYYSALVFVFGGAYVAALDAKRTAR